MSYSGYLEQHSGSDAAFIPRAGYGVQAKLKVSQPGDPLEQEADQMAERVVSGPPAGAFVGSRASAGVQRQSEDEGDSDAAGGGESAEAEQDDETTAVSAKLMRPGSVVHRAASRDSRDKEQDEEKIDSLSAKPSPGGAVPGPVAAPIAAQIRGVQNSGGRPLSRGVRRAMEPHFRRSLAGVRVHTDAGAVRTASAIKARAYTLGRDVVFNQGEFQPETIQGRRLLAHELTHVVQQGGV
ncbi:MAG: DUF4157 domain-containing protein [Leptospirales bacterium]|jgi:hypothetical protein